MIIKILGILDILTAFILWLSYSFHIIPTTLITILALYLLVKGIVFLISLDIASIIDVVCSGIIFLSLGFSVPAFLLILVSLFLLQKGILSLLA